MIKQVPQGQFPGRSLGDRRLDIWGEARKTVSLTHKRPSLEEITLVYNKLCETFGVTGTDRGRDSGKTRPSK